jgi:hypothetical protein
VTLKKYQKKRRCTVAPFELVSLQAPDPDYKRAGPKVLSNWRSQFVTSKKDKIGLRYSPMAFTEQGVAMLSSVLNSERAIEVNIQIMRVFARFRQILLINKDLRRELEELKRGTDDRFRVVFETLDQLLSHEERPKRKIGFEVKEKAVMYKFKRRGLKLRALSMASSR